MLKIEIKEGEKIERALKRYKRKVRNVKLHDQVRDNRYFTKPSVVRRKQLEKAAYKEKYITELEND
ncbi:MULTISPECIES: 30S ribosomal protein S21 [Flavobacteriaceae]|uniref:30S ribosomal protein S21 n=1 Tax=Flavobacteriaceae TaxID=49546 RepID=UPI0010AED404|nr:MULTISPECIES: 30S ribosomal protein S21 [Flavobacteriaceae]NJB37958.1 30S ribosomal protein S21 [Croceivirga sp. JEA036]TKD60667.1 30S ribosomal protein S21 [Flavobacterium sp. ASW18X]